MSYRLWNPYRQEHYHHSVPIGCQYCFPDIHHICLEVDDVDKELTALGDKGAKLIDKQGRQGLAGKIGFIHPKATKGVLIELAQKL